MPIRPCARLDALAHPVFALAGRLLPRPVDLGTALHLPASSQGRRASSHSAPAGNSGVFGLSFRSRSRVEVPEPIDPYPIVKIFAPESDPRSVLNEHHL
jgi:hypothetical protein